MTSSYLRWSAAIGAMAAAITTAPAFAAEDQAAAPQQAQSSADELTSDRLNEIVVTATRRDSNLQRTPVAVSAVDSSLIRQASPRDIGDLAAFVPNFSASTITNFNAASFAMRGVGQTSIIVYFEPPVAVLVDDFVVPSVQTQLLDTFDISQVEVLRGPQGTLFGKNTTGGAVTVRTKRPELGVVGVDGRAEIGSFGTRKVQVAGNVPIFDNMALRLVGGMETTDGFYKNGACYGPVGGVPTSNYFGVSGCLDGKSAGGKDVVNLRAKLLWEPTSRLSILAQYEWLRDRSETVPSVNENSTYTGDVPFLTDILGTIRQNPNSSDPLDNAAVTYRQDGLIKMKDGQRISVDGFYVNADYDLDFGKLTSVTGWRRQLSRIPNSYAGAAPIGKDGTPLSFFDATRDDNRKTFQQELRFATNTGTAFDMVAGAFYQRETVDFCVAQLLGFLDLQGVPLGLGNWNDTPFILCNAQRSKSTAVFAEGTYKITPELSLTVGGRYTWEDKTWYGRQQVFIPQLNGGFDPSIVVNEALDASVFRYPANVITLRNKANKPTWRATLGYQATPDVYTYLNYSRGFKAGGFNDQIGGFAAFTDAATGVIDFDAFREAARATKPETADSFEAGIKTELLDHRLRFNLTGFYVKYKDLQKQLNVPIVVNGAPNQVTLFVNAASATVKGIEAEATARLFKGFTLRGVLGYQDGKYNKYTADGAGYNLADAPLDRAPKWQWTVDGTYEVPLGSDFKVIANASAAYTGRNLNTQSITDIDGNTFLNARTLVNASLTLSQVDDKYYVKVIGRNLTDARYRIASQNVAGLWLNSNFGAPRYFGAEIGVKFRGP
ncbi:TonB-dependent receptor [Novosphingobium cyanobacteriorum]|uniref:TonB-dependent receptor n=1 Tax=Novosphingobium cyanobacteriorum TaxID=3024215 RepID=A0ABT6CLC1_9SPHN|nr:TonB-dependent receptor [Novosphingobium cyanobacteriorum]MDF8334647.1 TonB-dependent receptor [Novosphingobium cyanobacteriorum]